jgi:hypothetical protein
MFPSVPEDKLKLMPLKLTYGEIGENWLSLPAKVPAGRIPVIDPYREEVPVTPTTVVPDTSKTPE